MSNSSQPTNYTEDLLNDVLISASGTGVSSDCITITLPSDTMSNATYDTMAYSGNTITLTGGGVGSTYTLGTSDTITISNDSFTNIWTTNEEWVDSFPDWDRVKDMCSKYPSLEIALRNFETIYKLVKDDYDNPTPKV